MPRNRILVRRCIFVRVCIMQVLTPNPRTPNPRDDAVREMLHAVPQRIAALTYEVAMVSCTLKLAHRDPADRLLAATAKVHGLTLVTADSRLLASREYATLANSVRHRGKPASR